MAEAHSHCNHCVLSVCSAQGSCPVKSCPECDACLHSCKLHDHLAYVCPEAKVPCINVQYGCNNQTKRRLLNRHLEHCPAWIIQCKFSYKRNTVSHINQPEWDSPRLPDEQHLADDWELLSQSNPDFDNDSVRSMALLDIAVVPLQRIFSKNLNFNERPAHLIKSIYQYSDIHLHNLNLFGAFSCGQMYRRDEHWSHYHNHNELSEMNLKIRRCPLLTYGCTVAAVEYGPVQADSNLIFHPDSRSIVVKPSQSISLGNSVMGLYGASLAKKKELAEFGYDEWDGSLDNLGQLPIEVLLHITQFLDSLSLYCLSQVNKYLRQVCKDLVNTRGLIHTKWEKSGANWISNELKYLSLSKTSQEYSWIPQASSKPIVKHMSQCEVLATLREDQYTPGLAWDVDPTRGQYCKMNISEVNFKRR